MLENVVTYHAPGTFKTINVTPDQERRLTEQGRWPRTDQGIEYCQVSEGLHLDEPTPDSKLGL